MVGHYRRRLLLLKRSNASEALAEGAGVETKVARVDIMKVVVDMNLCDLHGLCVEAAPEVFEIGDDGELHVLNETPDPGLRAKVDKAVRECPTGAISIEE